MADKKTSVKELQTFIDAVEFASDSDEWVPSKRQWDRIRSMINNLEESSVTASPAPAPVYQQPHAWNGHTSIGPSGFTPVTTLPPPSLPSGPFATGHGNVRTPDVDTSNGTYQSPFGA